jgi:hypothetical protein
VIHFGDPLRHRAEDGAIVDFLERLASVHVGSDLADEDDHRGRILHRRVDADRGIGRARPARDKAQPRLSGQFAPGRRHEGGTAFVAAKDELQRPARVVERVEHREIAFAGHAETAPGAEGDQAVDEELATVAH